MEMEVSFIVKDGSGTREVPLNTWGDHSAVEFRSAAPSSSGATESRLNVYQAMVVASLLSGGAGMARRAMETWEQRPARQRTPSIFEEMERRPPARVVEDKEESKRARRRRQARAKRGKG